MLFRSISKEPMQFNNEEEAAAKQRLECLSLQLLRDECAKRHMKKSKIIL